MCILCLKVLFGRQQREAHERKAAIAEEQRMALMGGGDKEKRGEFGEHDGDVLPHKPLQMLQVGGFIGDTWRGQRARTRTKLFETHCL